jgi:uncharacterized protein YhdP
VAACSWTRRTFACTFPRSIREPLDYDDAFGQLYFSWDGSGLRIDSGLMRAAGEEGAARGLFAVDIPFVPRVTGVELELLIGLEDSRVDYRGKYLPYRLPAPLLDWLGRAIPSGGCWPAPASSIRGSTRRKNPEHMTVQLFVDARNATLAYDPRWPALTAMDAEVWVDDGRTWGRAAQANSDGAAISDLMLRVQPQPGGPDWTSPAAWPVMRRVRAGC